MTADGFCVHCFRQATFDLVKRVGGKPGHFVVYLCRCRSCNVEQRKTVSLNS